jgi:hypothetical protein
MGLDTWMIFKLKKKAYKEGQGFDKECTICFEEFKSKEEVLQTPCKHIFHQKCIKPWFEKVSKCPNCRAKVNEFFEK